MTDSLSSPETTTPFDAFSRAIDHASPEYDALLSDVEATISERGKNARTEYTVGYHEVGQRIATDPLYVKWGSATLLQRIAKDIGRSERTLYYAVKFYEQFPQLEDFPDGVDAPWGKTIEKYLTSPDPDKPEPDRCETCGQVLRKRRK